LAKSLSQSPRNVRRRARYSYLRERGFTAETARAYRGRNAESITTLQRTGSRIRKTRIKPLRRGRRGLEDRQEITTKEDRLDDFRSWTRNKNFPQWVLEEIRATNRKAGLRPNSSLGFRVFYHTYVNKVTSKEAQRRGEMRDT
jgi:hypothetical protein